ncbi:MAG TPA: DUF6159 family protein [Chitinophagaceae bacterium]|nr:DUF6159 family protein [Chitinophagaceae bacterium]
MNFFDRLGNGWTIAMSSFKVLKEKKDLVIFPILSGISILLVVGSFFTAVGSSIGWNTDNLGEYNAPLYYLILFVFYVVNYFIVVFFNMALVHCSRLYFRGEEVSVRDGIKFSMSRIGVIFSWAFFAATVGLVLKMIQENSGWLGRIITGIIGVVWGVAIFFVVPVIAYENKGPIEAVKRSIQLMKQKWGESLGATFSFGLIQFIGVLVVAATLFFVGSIFHPIAGFALAFIGAFLVVSIISAAEVIFVSAVYHNIDGDLDKHFNQQMVNDLFEKKGKSSWLN